MTHTRSATSMNLWISLNVTRRGPADDGDGQYCQGNNAKTFLVLLCKYIHIALHAVDAVLSIEM
jgi:hypothetical protein